jgi:hypothetical protein
MVPMARWDDGMPAVLGEAEIDPRARSVIELMNRRHAVIGNIGGKCKVLD